MKQRNGIHRSIEKSVAVALSSIPRVASSIVTSDRNLNYLSPKGAIMKSGSTRNLRETKAGNGFLDKLGAV